MDDDLPSARGRTDLIAATADEAAEALSYALRYEDWGRLVEHLRRAGFILMRARPACPHGTG